MFLHVFLCVLCAFVVNKHIIIILSHYLQESLLSLESHLAEQGYSLRKLLSYLADLNEQEIHCLQQVQKLELLMIFGGDDLIGLQKIFARYFDELSHKGVKTILITGGIGRLTTTLIQALLDQQTDGTFPSLSIHRQDDKTQIHFQLTEKFLGRKKVKTIKMPPFDLKASKESLLPYVAEADIYLELLLYEFLQHGYSPDEIEIIGYADYLRDSNQRFVLDQEKTETARREKLLEHDSSVYTITPERLAHINRAHQHGKIVLFLENASTNTGNNTSYALELLIAAGYINTQEDARQIARRTAVYQQPALQLRTKYTVEKQFGALPLSVSYVPDYDSLSLQERAKLFLIMVGEYRRLCSYSQPPYNFFRRPENFDEGIVTFSQEHSEMLKTLEFMHKT